MPGVATDEVSSCVCDTLSFCSLSVLLLAMESTRNLPNVLLSFLGTSWKAHPTLEWDDHDLWGAGHSGKEGAVTESPLPSSMAPRNQQAKASSVSASPPALTSPFPLKKWSAEVACHLLVKEGML